MFEYHARQVMRDAETFASDERDFVREHHVTKALLKGRGISATVLKSFGVTMDNVPDAPLSAKDRFAAKWKTSEEGLYVTNYSPQVLGVWLHAQALLTQTGRSDAAEFFLLGLLESPNTEDYRKMLVEKFGIDMTKVYRRIKMLQELSIYYGSEPECHSRRLQSLAQVAFLDQHIDEGLSLIDLSLAEIFAGRKSEKPDGDTMLSRGQALVNASRYYIQAGEKQASLTLSRRGRRYRKLGDVTVVKAQDLQDREYRASQLGFFH